MTCFSLHALFCAYPLLFHGLDPRLNGDDSYGAYGVYFKRFTPHLSRHRKTDKAMPRPLGGRLHW